MISFEIPKQLQDRKFYFILVEKNGKKPTSIAWTTPENSLYFDNDELAKHIEEGGNYGILTGHGLIVIDADKKELQDRIESILPETFTVKTPRENGGKHYYFFNDSQKKILIGKGEQHVGELQARGQQIICAGSQREGKKYEIIKDLPIASITDEIIKIAIAPWVEEEKIEPTKEQKEFDNLNLSIREYIPLAKMKRHGNEYYGEHPIHGSETGQNFWVNTSKNVWHCFRCDSGGGVLQWLAVQEGLITCDKAKKNCLKGQVFRRLKEIVVEKYGVVFPKKENQIENLLLELTNNTNWLGFADKFVDNNGVYYDNQKIWWFWNKQKYCWEMVDETDIMNMVDKALAHHPLTVQINIKAQIIEALKRKARLQKPEEPKEDWVQFKDKIVDVINGETFESTKKYFFTNPIPWSIGETEETPEMDKLFEEWVGKEQTQMLYEIIAFCLSTRYFIHTIFCFTGSGSNGKSRYLALVEKFIGKNNVCSTELDLLVKGNFESAKLYKKLVATMGETNFSTINKTSLLKKLTGEDLVGFEFKGKNSFDDLNYAKIIIATNTLPVTEDRTRGFYRRWLIIDFPHEFKNIQDVLKRITETEYNNLAKKCINLLKKLKENREFTNEPDIDAKEKRYEEKSNPIKTFIGENYVIDINGQVPFFQFYDDYLAFLSKRGFRAQSRREVGKALEVEGYNTERKHTKKEDGTETTWHYVMGLREKEVLEKDYL